MKSKSHDEEYKWELLEQIENGQNAGDIAWEYELPVKTIRRWMDEGRRDQKNTFAKKRRAPESQKQHDYSTDHKRP